MRNTPQQSWLRWLSLAGMAALVALGVGLVVVFRAAQSAPAFYTRVIEVDRTQGVAQAQALETHVLDLNSEVRHEDRWQLTLSTDELNSWLAITLPERFPRALPPEVSLPRVAIEPKLIQVACKYDSGSISSVLSIGIEPYLIEDPSTLALRIRHVRAGILPIPVRQFLDDVAKRAVTSGMHLRWDEIDGDPVALLKIDIDPKHINGRQVLLDTLDIQAGQLTLGGTSERQSKN